MQDWTWVSKGDHEASTEIIIVTKHNYKHQQMIEIHSTKNIVHYLKYNICCPFSFYKK